MSKLNSEETLYDILRISPRATFSEITSAYHTAKNAFSKDSLATYSLMPEEDSAAFLTQLETAYMTLTNPDKRRAYDNRLASGGTIQEEASMTHTQPTLQSSLSTAPPINIPTQPQIETNFSDSTLIIGLNLVQIRESKGLTLSDVSRITKIPIRYLKALEEYDSKALPAKVYIQGFLRNLVQLYRLDPKNTVSSYMEQLEKLSGSSQT